MDDSAEFLQENEHNKELCYIGDKKCWKVFIPQDGTCPESFIYIKVDK
jgi:hypothetical protein